MTQDEKPINLITVRDSSASPEGDEAYEFSIDADNAGTRLDKWLSDKIEALTRTRIKALIDGGSVTRNGEVFTDPSWKLREGEVYHLQAPPPVDPIPEAENIPLNIVYEDHDLIVINKPAGMVVHPAAGNWSGTLVNALIYHCGDSLSGIGGVARPGIVHRIDKDTSGLLVVAKGDRAHQGLAKAFSKHDIERVYEAIAVGAPRPGFGTIDAALARSTSDRTKMTVVRLDTHSKARHAITHYKISEAFGRSRAKLKGDALASLIECRLETGRTHQIRVHLAHIGHPIIGDPAYGRGPGLSGLKPGDDAADHTRSLLQNFCRQALHAKTLGFMHPISGETLRFECAPPEDFQELLTALRVL